MRSFLSGSRTSFVCWLCRVGGNSVVVGLPSRRDRPKKVEPEEASFELLRDGGEGFEMVVREVEFEVYPEERTERDEDELSEDWRLLIGDGPFTSSLDASMLRRSRD